MSDVAIYTVTKEWNQTMWLCEDHALMREATGARVEKSKRPLAGPFGCDDCKKEKEA